MQQGQQGQPGQPGQGQQGPQWQYAQHGRYPWQGQGHRQAPGRVRWVATVPAGVTPPRRAVAREAYAGPPAYAHPPFWGFPHLAWRQSTAVPGTAFDGTNQPRRLRMIARNVQALLWTVAGLAVIAGAAEVWRYALLVISRDTALSPSVVGTSDAFVLVFSLLTFVLAALAVAGVAWWLFAARSVADNHSGQRPARPGWQVALGTLVPGPNLVLAGPIVAELEHAALGRPAEKRPRPSRLVLAWWGAWWLNAGLLLVTIGLRMRDGVQADADGVLITAVTDLSAAGLAVLTLFVIDRITRFLTPIDDRRLKTLLPLRVTEVRGAPEPARRTRPATATR